MRWPGVDEMLNTGTRSPETSIIASKALSLPSNSVIPHSRASQLQAYGARALPRNFPLEPTPRDDLITWPSSILGGWNMAAHRTKTDDNAAAIARQFGCSIKALRLYEEMGLLT